MCFFAVSFCPINDIKESNIKSYILATKALKVSTKYPLL